MLGRRCSGYPSYYISLDIFWVERVAMLIVCCSCSWGGQSVWPDSEVTQTNGHYPPVYCRLTHVILDKTRAKFLYQTQLDTAIQSKCPSSTENMWPFQRYPDMGSVYCDKTFDKAYVFSIYYYYGSNYFHLHYDMMLPLYLVLHDGRKSAYENVVLMPSVESSRMEIMNWDTPAFADPTSYWMELLHTPQFQFGDRALVQRYVSFIKRQLKIPNDYSTNVIQQHRIGIITRAKGTRRRILNEEELQSAISHIAPVDMIEFAGRSFKNQVEIVQNYTILVGLNGAGLTNALYLPSTSVAVQLVPYNASLNFKEFGQLLSSRGPYLEWHNTHPELSFTDHRDPYNNRADTIVRVEELTQLVIEAISLHEEARLRKKTEL